MAVTNKVVLGGLNVRLFTERRDAIGYANQLTTFHNEQHQVKRLEGGWLIANATKKDVYYDADGKIPEGALKLVWCGGYWKVSE